MINTDEIVAKLFKYVVSAIIVLLLSYTGIIFYIGYEIGAIYGNS